MTEQVIECNKEFGDKRECFFSEEGECCIKCKRNKRCQEPQGDFYTPIFEDGY